ncbi:SDR family oxidoreductase [Novosphingobium sp.]|uniref:SDR family oxidoreductase n=1 Tax=Novosphingobium sp. TaxID=1874826 RepID=UPI003BA99BFD
MASTVLITGASSGIGAAATKLFAANGWNVVATMRTPSSDLASPPNMLTLKLDVTDAASISAALDAAVSRFGTIDLLVNNAGFGPLGPIETFDEAVLQRLFDTNVFGTIRMAQAVIPLMRKRGTGRIINISSMGGEFTTPYGGAYHASKYAVESVSDALRYEAKAFGIDVVVVQPGPVLTPMALSAADMPLPAGDSPYWAPVSAMSGMAKQQLQSGSGFVSANAVAATIFKAALARKPRTRYKVGMTAHVMPFLRRWLSDRQWDGMWRMILGRAEKALEPKAAR